MTWSVGAPPTNLREIWAPWERVHTLRTVLATGALVLQAVAVGLKAARVGGEFNVAAQQRAEADGASRRRPA